MLLKPGRLDDEEFKIMKTHSVKGDVVLLETNKKILIIDDDPNLRRMMELKFKKQGYHVILARNGEEGLDLIKTQQPDAVITDLNMPKLDGKTLCEQTNYLKKERPFLTIIVTGQISSDEKKWISEMLDTEVMLKPFSPTNLLNQVEKYFNRDY